MAQLLSLNVQKSLRTHYGSKDQKRIISTR
jgi:hypothetical protein